MSHSLILLEILIDGRPRSAVELSELSGLSIQQVLKGMQMLRKRKSMRALSVPYQITEAGRDWLAERQERETRMTEKVKPPPKPRGRPPLPVDERIARDMQRRRRLVEVRREKRQRERAVAQEDARLFADRQRIATGPQETVEQARASRSALEMAWGGAHA